MIFWDDSTFLGISVCFSEVRGECGMWCSEMLWKFGRGVPGLLGLQESSRACWPPAHAVFLSQVLGSARTCFSFGGRWRKPAGRWPRSRGCWPHFPNSAWPQQSTVGATYGHSVGHLCERVKSAADWAWGLCPCSLPRRTPSPMRGECPELWGVHVCECSHVRVCRLLKWNQSWIAVKAIKQFLFRNYCNKEKRCWYELGYYGHKVDTGDL